MFSTDYAKLQNPNGTDACLEYTRALQQHHLQYEYGNCDRRGGNCNVAMIGRHVQRFKDKMHCQIVPLMYDEDTYPNPEINE